VHYRSCKPQIADMHCEAHQNGEIVLRSLIMRVA
jgi:hypothetical protein